MKPSWKTGEFWTTLVTSGIAVLVVLGVISAADRATVEGNVLKMVESAFALIVWAASQWRLTASREAVKVEAEKTKQVAVNALGLTPGDKSAAIEKVMAG